VKEPRRTALGLLYEMFGEAAFGMAGLAPVQAFSPAELGPLKDHAGAQPQFAADSSAGRLFDAVAALAGLRQQVRFEGQAAMELEFALDASPTNEAYEFSIRPEHAPLQLDWHPMVESILTDLKRGAPVSQISAGSTMP